MEDCRHVDHTRTDRDRNPGHRLRLISLITANAASEACVCDLTEPLGLSQGTVSHHLKVLVDTGLFTREKRGRWAYYRLVPGALDSIARSLISA
ncbi:ArsR/SmtB family transcription factor [Cryobacterium aureum]|uniref:ArsR/SmtB family transcription factor n=1 Tax=Cryobacterium aureum TaxID=995037 RepID=UPI001F0BFD5C|nr:metalloregulator ArsR/SmtB family transcription factor [Cryobacterium aureum]